MKKLNLKERILVVLIGGGIVIGSIAIPLLIMAYAKTWMIALGAILAFRCWIKEVTSCK